VNAPRIHGASIAAATKLAGVIVPRDDRAADIATILDHAERNRVVDDMLLSRVFRRFGWEMLTDEALAMLADAYEANAATRERMAAENRATARRATLGATP